MVRLAIAGANGRMGKAFVQAAVNDRHVTLTGAIVSPNSPLMAIDVGVIAGISSLDFKPLDDLTKIINDFDILVDFTKPEPTMNHLKICQQYEKKMVIGATGFSAAQKSLIQEAGQSIAMVFAPNMSVGMNLTYRLLKQVCEVLGDDADIEIVEAHHRNKIDAPSGAALKMGEVMCQALGRQADEISQYGRRGISEVRDKKTIGFSSIRGGDIVGDHTVIFASEGERLEITHRATNRGTFAQGAIRAARWLIQKDKGFYTMDDVLFAHAS